MKLLVNFYIPILFGLLVAICYYLHGLSRQIATLERSLMAALKEVRKDLTTITDHLADVRYGQKQSSRS